MKKAILFVQNKMPTYLGVTLAELKSKGYRVTVSNGNITKGFEDSCDEVFMEVEFPHVAEWCKRNFIKCSVVGEQVEEEKIEPKLDATIEPEPEDDTVEKEARAEYEEIFGKKAGNMKLDKILAKIEEAKAE